MLAQLYIDLMAKCCKDFLVLNILSNISLSLTIEFAFGVYGKRFIN
jgi:hypothetical protein